MRKVLIYIPAVAFPLALAVSLIFDWTLSGLPPVVSRTIVLVLYSGLLLWAISLFKLIRGQESPEEEEQNLCPHGNQDWDECPDCSREGYNR